MFDEEKKKVKEKIKTIFPISINRDENKKGTKRKIENLVVFIIILIVTVILINTIWNEDKNNKKTHEETAEKMLATTNNSFETVQTSSLTLENKLENILQSIEGVGKVKVLLTYSESSRTLAMFNEDISQSDTEETDSGGGNRKIAQSSSKKEVIYQEINGEKIPVTQSIVEPKIEGAIISATGAENSKVKESIVQAIEAATGLATHKIQVFPMSNTTN